jgi:hypothetical protein
MILPYNRRLLTKYDAGISPTVRKRKKRGVLEMPYADNSPMLAKTPNLAAIRLLLITSENECMASPTVSRTDGVVSAVSDG